MSSKIFRVNILFAALAFLYSSYAKAEDVVASTTPMPPSAMPSFMPASIDTSTTTPFPFYPRLNLYAGTGSKTYGRADALAPLFGSANGIFYTDVDLSRNNDANRDLGLGIGTRIATSDDFMWGAYIFGDRSRSNLNNISNDWTTINPGFEYMTNYWDGRLNFYIPTGDEEKVSGTFFGDQLGIPNSTTIIGHKQYGELYNVTQEIGPGADLDFGYTFTGLNRFRLHGGGYAFIPKDTEKVYGGEAGAELPINNYFTLEVADAYDNIQQNKVTFSLRVTLGGADKSSNPTVQDRILDPVNRHLGVVGTNSGIPVVGENVDTGQSALER